MRQTPCPLRKQCSMTSNAASDLGGLRTRCTKENTSFWGCSSQSTQHTSHHARLRGLLGNERLVLFKNVNLRKIKGRPSNVPDEKGLKSHNNEMQLVILVQILDPEKISLSLSIKDISGTSGKFQ